VPIHVNEILVSPCIETARIVLVEEGKLRGEVVAVTWLASDREACEGYIGHGWVEEGSFDWRASSNRRFSAFSWIERGGQ
jgi:hypothetical protein